MELTVAQGAVLTALINLGGEEGPGAIAAAAGVPSRTVTRVLAALRDLGLVESAKGGKGRVRITPSGRAARQQHALPPASAGAAVDVALSFWAGLGLYAHRAALELLLAAIVARHHLGAGKPDKHLVLMFLGESGTGKNTLAEMACTVLGLGDVARYRIYCPSTSAGQVVGRSTQAEGGWTFRPSQATRWPLVLFDEFDKVTGEVERALMVHLDGSASAQFEGEVFHLAPVPVLAANPPQRGPRYAQIRDEFLRRAALLDTGYAAHRVDDIGEARDAYDEQSRAPLNLEELRLPPAVPPVAKWVLRRIRDVLTSPAPPQPALEAATLGLAALIGDTTERGVLLAALRVVVAYLTVTETVEGQVLPDWRLNFEALREHLEGHGGLDELEQVVAAAQEVRSQTRARVDRARIAGDVEDLELTGAKHALAGDLQRAADAIDGRGLRKASDADKSAADGLRAQLRRMRTEVLDCRSRARLEDLRTVVAGPLGEARELRRRIDREKDQRERDREQEAEQKRQNRALEQTSAAWQKELDRQRKERDTARLAEVRREALEGERLWKAKRVANGQPPPWRQLEQRGLLRFEPDPAPPPEERRGLRGFMRGVLDVTTGTAGAGWWTSTGDPSVAFRGTQADCPSLAQWGEATRAVLLPWLAPLHAEENELVARLPRSRARTTRPPLYRPQLVAAPAIRAQRRPGGAQPLRVQSQRIQRAELPPAQRGW